MTGRTLFMGILGAAAFAVIIKAVPEINPARFVPRLTAPSS